MIGTAVIYFLKMLVVPLVVGVILFHALFTLPAILRFFTKINPYAYLSDVREAPIMAFPTASSAATLPVSMRVVEEIGGVDRILDMCRTSLNVTSDLIVTKIVDEFEKRR